MKTLRNSKGVLLGMMLVLLPLLVMGAALNDNAILNSIFNGTNAIRIDINQENITGNVTVGGTLAVTGVTTLTGNLLANGTIRNKTCTIADGDATPDVAGCQILTTSSNTGATAITDLDNPLPGSIVVLVGGSATNSSTIADSGNFALSAAWTATVDETLTLFIQADNDYVELGRSTN